MKAIILLLLLSMAANASAQTLSSNAVSSPPVPSNSTAVVVSPYAIAVRGPNSRLWQQVTASTNSSGQTNYFTNSYNELGTGICFWNSNSSQWVDSSDQIQLTGDGAIATNTQHQVTFAANINTVGAINLTTPDGKQMISQIMGLAYTDADTGSNVLFAELQDSIGQLLPSGNQVLYSNAFTNADCDVLYTHRLSSFEQDIIIREQLPSPSSVGLAGSNIWLQVWTEFTNAPVPQITALSSGDSRLDFGIMKIDKGTAFLLNGPSNSAPVIKEWVTNSGRTFLVESVQLSAMASQLSQLPAPSSGSSNSVPGTNSSGLGAQLKFGNNRAALASVARPHANARTLKLPPRKVAKRESGPMRLAAGDLDPRGLLLDYSTVNGSVTNQIFQSDTTYYVSSELDCYGTNTIEGGTVIKCGVGNCVFVYGDFVCDTAPYRPAIFTVTNDDTVGAVISGSDGGCSLTINSPFYLPNTSTMSNIFFRYSWNAFNSDYGDAEIWDCQFYRCSHCITPGSDTTNLGLHNVLIVMDDSINNSTNYCGCRTGAIVSYSSAISVYGEHVTANLDSQNLIMYFTDIWNTNATSFTFTNSIIITPNLNPQYNYGSAPTMTVSTNYTLYSSSLPSGLFQTVGAGNCYLANGSIYHNAGTTNVEVALLADLASKTTYPPVVLSNITVSESTVLDQEVPRDNFGAPDIGYHYTPLDFIVDYFTITNAPLVLTNGVAIAYYTDPYGIVLLDGSSIASVGGPVNPNWFTSYQMVQEQAITVGAGETPYYLDAYHYGSTGPNGTFQFSKFSGGGIYFSDEDPAAYNNLLVEECEFYANGSSVYATFYGSTNSAATTVLNNNLFARSVPYIQPAATANFAFSNNLVWCAAAKFRNGAGGNCCAFNNIFDTCTIGLGAGGSTSSNGYNAYLNCGTNRLSPTNAFDIVSSNSLAYEWGPLGTFYQPTNSPLIYMGSTNANLVGLYQYTTQTNETKDTTNIVTIGYHYVAVGTNGLPLSYSGDGIGDYLKDSSGDGIYDAGDLGNWLVSETYSNGVSDYIKYLEGINLNATNYSNDTSNVINLEVYTPLH